MIVYIDLQISSWYLNPSDSYSTITDKNYLPRLLT